MASTMRRRQKGLEARHRQPVLNEVLCVMADYALAVMKSRGNKPRISPTTATCANITTHIMQSCGSQKNQHYKRSCFFLQSPLVPLGCNFGSRIALLSVLNAFGVVLFCQGALRPTKARA